MPIFIKGIENSIAISRCDDIVRGATAKSASWRTNSPTFKFLTNHFRRKIVILTNKITIPFHSPFASENEMK